MVQAGSLLASMGAFDIVGTTASGWLTDRYDPRKLLFAYYALRGLSLMALPFLSFDLFSLSLFAVFYGLDWLATVPPTVRLTTESFGERDGPIVFGWVAFGHQIGAAAAAFGAGLLRDLRGRCRRLRDRRRPRPRRRRAALAVRRRANPPLRPGSASLSQRHWLRNAMNALVQRTAGAPAPGRGGAMSLWTSARGPAGRHRLPHANGFNAHLPQHPGPGPDLRITARPARPWRLDASTVIEGRDGWARQDLLALLAAETQAGDPGRSPMGGTSSLLAAAAEPGGRALALFDPVVAGRGRTPDNPWPRAPTAAARLPGQGRALAAYTGRGGFRTWSAEQLADVRPASLTPGAR
jgi:hypothetical protein